METLEQSEIAYVRKAQSSKTLVDAKNEPRDRSKEDIYGMSHEFIRVWQHGLADPIKIRGMLYTGKCS